VTRPVPWGVLGASSYVFRQALLPAMRDSGAAELVATASRSGPDHDSEAERRYGHYAELLADPVVEAVYLPLPNDLHEPWTLAAAEAGKHVLCEKPLAPDAAGARRMAAACEAAGVVLAEAYMTPHHPRSARWDELIGSGLLGTPLHGTARFSFPHSDPTDYRWRPDAGGGALLDLGIYCLEPLLAAGRWRPGDALPEISAHALRADSGVDATTTGLLTLPSGFTAAFCCSFDAAEAQVLEVVGTQATMVVSPAFTPDVDDTAISVTRRDGRVTTVHSAPGAEYTRMLDHVGAVIRRDATPQRTPADAVALLEVLDAVRAATGGST
jgi:xylose dehydrogenase (NAD/NADP)